MKRLLTFLALTGASLALAVGSAPAKDERAVVAVADNSLEPAQQRQIEEIIRTYLTENPEVIVEALTAYESTRREAEQLKAEQALASRSDDLAGGSDTPTAGNPSGDVTVVEFFDYRCGYCKRILPDIQTLLETDSGVRYVFKEFPILGPQSLAASKAAQASWSIAPDLYLPFHVALMETRSELTEERILQIASSVGIDAEELQKAMDAPEIEEKLRRNIQLGQEIGVRGTPAFVIDGNLVPGAIDLSTMREMVAEARSG